MEKPNLNLEVTMHVKTLGYLLEMMWRDGYNSPCFSPMVTNEVRPRVGGDITEEHMLEKLEKAKEVLKQKDLRFVSTLFIIDVINSDAFKTALIAYKGCPPEQEKQVMQFMTTIIAMRLRDQM